MLYCLQHYLTIKKKLYSNYLLPFTTLGFSISLHTHGSQGLSPKLPRPIFSPANENGIPTLLYIDHTISTNWQ